MAGRSTDKLIGLGVYDLAEVARYTGLSSARVRSWFKVRSDGRGRGPLLQSDFKSIGNDFAVSFLDLIDVLVAGELREQGVSMPVVRAAHSVLSGQLSTRHPFAHSDIFTDGKRVFRLAVKRMNTTELSEVISRQQFFLTVKDKLHHVDYSDSTQLAQCWRISEGIVIDPRISLGKPVIRSTGVTTFVLANQFFANGKNAAIVADLFSVTENSVLHAVEFESQFGVRRAA